MILQSRHKPHFVTYAVGCPRCYCGTPVEMANIPSDKETTRARCVHCGNDFTVQFTD